MRFSVIPLLILLLPLAEIAGFVAVGREIGVLATVGLVLAAAVAGLVLIRFQGLGTAAGLKADMAAGRDPGLGLARGIMALTAGLLLIVPGFLTDVLALLLLIPGVRDLIWKRIGGRLTVVGSMAGAGRFARGARGARGSRTIDLDEDDYRRTPDPQSPWRKIDGD